MLVQQGDDFLLANAFRHGDQPVFRRHDTAYRQIRIGFKTPVTAGDNSDQVIAIDDRYAGYIIGAGQLDDLANTGRGRDRYRVLDDAAFKFLHPLDFGRLLFRRQIFMNDADPALLGQGNGQPGLGDRVHGSRQQRNLQLDLPGQLADQADITRQDGGVCR